MATHHVRGIWYEYREMYKLGIFFIFSVFVPGSAHRPTSARLSVLCLGLDIIIHFVSMRAIPPPHKRGRSANGLRNFSSSSDEGATTARAAATTPASTSAPVVNGNGNGNMNGNGNVGGTRRSGGGYLTSRESALVLAGETISLAVTHWLMEESYRDVAGDRALGALSHAAVLLTSPGRTNAFLLDTVRRSLRAGVAVSRGVSVCYSWTRYNTNTKYTNYEHSDFEDAKINYITWDPAITHAEWAAETIVLRRIREAIEYAIVHCQVTIYAPIATVVDKIAHLAAQRVQTI